MRPVLLLSLWFAVSCSSTQKDSPAHEQGRVIGARLDSAKIGDTITIRAFGGSIGESWYIFPPYTPDSVVNGSLGFHWPEIEYTSIRDYDDITLWVLVAHGSVVAWHEQPATLDLADLERGRAYSIDARFVVDSTNNGPGWRRLTPLR